jgi:hypothetical protein
MATLSEHECVPEAIPIARCRKLLGDEADDLSDAEVDEIRLHAQAMAHLLIELACGRDLHA